MELIDFINNVKKVNSSRKHKINNSYGVYDYYKYYRKNKPKENKYVLTESQYFSIIRTINKLIAERLILGEDIKLPCKMGNLELRKYNTKIQFDGKKIKDNLPIDWDKTLKLWYEDKESYESKTLVKAEEKEIFRFYYNKIKANYNNQVFYQFLINRDIKKRVKNKIKQGEIDAFTL